MLQAMELSEVYVGLGAERFSEILRGISKGSLRTYKVYDSFKIRTRLSKINREKLRGAAPKLFERLEQGDQDLAKEIAQAALVSNMSLIISTLDLLEIEHDGNGFFDKQDDVGEKLDDGWRSRVLEAFRGEYPEAVVLLYINHLDWELADPQEVFTG